MKRSKPTGTISGTTRTLGAPAFAYPVYDSHGNRIATLQRGASTGTYTVGSIRYYGAWGEVRVGATTGGSNPRFCASLGHSEDDDSGLVYMRARYYETASGRFLSTDPSRQGVNWFDCCRSDPINFLDQTGKTGMWEFLGLMLIEITAIALLPEELTGIALILTWGLVALGATLVIRGVVEDYSEFTNAGRERVYGAPCNGEDASGLLLNMIDKAKSTGNVLQKILASMAEITLWTALAMDGD